MHRKRLVAAMAFLAASGTIPAVFAQDSLNIPIVNGVKTTTPIVIVPFAHEGNAALPSDAADIIQNDFARTGLFRVLDKKDVVAAPSPGSDIQFAMWRQLKQDYIVVGRIKDVDTKTVQVEYELWDVNRQQKLLAQAMPPAPLSDFRGVTHQVADAIYQKITGVRGAFWTRIAYVSAAGLGNRISYTLVVADSDGFNPHVIAGPSKHPLLSPAWSPDGKAMAYVSFENGNSNIYVQNLETGKRQLIEGHAKGINGAPAWSPDGKKLAVALSFAGNLNLYTVDLASRRETKLTTDRASINTEPSWSPDGQSIYFTSDRSGKTQVYQVPSSGGGGERVSFQGQNNQNPAVSYDGKQIAMVQGNRNVYRVTIADRTLGDQVRFVSPGPYDESPSFAPNASMLLYAGSEGTHGALYSVSNDGNVRQRLMETKGDVREPAWGPYRTP